MPQRYLHTVHARKVESCQQGPPAKKATLDEVLAAHCRADLVTECTKKILIIIIRWPSFSFFGRKWMSIFVSFSAVNGVLFSSAFSFTAENEKNAFRSASSIHHKQVLRCKVLVLVLNTRLGLGLEIKVLVAHKELPSISNEPYKAYRLGSPLYREGTCRQAAFW